MGICRVLAPGQRFEPFHDRLWAGSELDLISAVIFLRLSNTIEARSATGMATRPSPVSKHSCEIFTTTRPGIVRQAEGKVLTQSEKVETGVAIPL